MKKNEIINNAISLLMQQRQALVDDYTSEELENTKEMLSKIQSQIGIIDNNVLEMIAQSDETTIIE